ncbi:putative protein C21B10.03c [Ceratocystis platani]|uniref:LsmAD domain-containing protein n=1 Tax=Ceratocystis fimbriata f. sp. platani TaxID=88771 RepID=A0A0F8CVL9_CERFI|nr:putative protein C21B10.03c [Ceratocystis platani]
MMPAPKKDSDFSRPRVPNGNNRMSFRTDTAISNNRGLHERTLQRWKPEGDGSLEGSLESTSNNANNNGRSWDQFAVNEKLFGLKTDYDENMYTTSIDRSHPQYKERLASADIKAREIERSAPVTNHQAEERIMDFIGADKGGDEEDKYSGVRRTQDFVPLNSSTATSTAKYTPPAKRAPSAQATVSGAPFDPAIISSQLRVANGSGSKRLAKGDDGRTNSTTSSSRASHTSAKVDTPKIDAPKPNDPKAQLQPQPAVPRLVDPKTSSPKPTDTSRPEAPSTPAAPKTHSATVNVERAVLTHFKQFASKERSNAEKVRSTKLRQDKEDRLLELRKFATTFKLTTPIPNDLIGIIAKDPAKQQQIAKKAKQNAHDAKTKPSVENDDAKNSTKDSTAISGTKDALLLLLLARVLALAQALLLVLRFIMRPKTGTKSQLALNPKDLQLPINQGLWVVMEAMDRATFNPNSNNSNNSNITITTVGTALPTNILHLQLVPAPKSTVLVISPRLLSLITRHLFLLQALLTHHLTAV